MKVLKILLAVVTIVLFTQSAYADDPLIVLKNCRKPVSPPLWPSSDKVTMSREMVAPLKSLCIDRSITIKPLRYDSNALNPVSDDSTITRSIGTPSRGCSKSNVLENIKKWGADRINSLKSLFGRKSGYHREWEWRSLRNGPSRNSQSLRAGTPNEALMLQEMLRPKSTIGLGAGVYKYNAIKVNPKTSK
jgi:hypothetical protein